MKPAQTKPYDPYIAVGQTRRFRLDGQKMGTSDKRIWGFANSTL